MTDEEKALLAAQAKAHGFATVTDFVKAVARGAVKVSPKIKALAFAAIGTGTGGGCLVWLIAPIAALAYLLA